MFRQADKGRFSRSSRLVIGGVAACATLLCVAVTPVEAAPKPPVITHQQVLAAAAAKRVVAQLVGELSAKLAQSQAEEQSAQAAAELSEQKYAYAMQRLTEATQQAAAAQTAVATAQKTIEHARTSLTSYVRSSYMAPSVGSSTIDLLTAQDPTALLQGGDYQNYISNHHLDALGALDRATVAKSNAKAKAETAKQLQQQRSNEANAARLAAEQAYATKKEVVANYQAAQVATEQQLAAAQLKLATLNNGRAKWLGYLKAKHAHDVAVAQAKARALAAAQERARQIQLQQQQALLAQQQQQQQQQQQEQNQNGGGGSVSTPVQTTGFGAPPGPSAGGWTAEKGQAAANKALSQLGVRYAWAGGGYNGPTYGVNSPGTDGWNDSQVYGFDCSGLTMFAWYPATAMPHYAASQYQVAGSYHPQPGDFQPGDLLFWSDGGASAIHHVALYIGGGNVVQAPNSGDVVKITPWDQVSYGYFGATRPLT